MANWCFAARPAYQLSALEGSYYIERLRVRDGQVIADLIEHFGTHPRFHVGVEVKTGRPGDSAGASNRDAIESACTQAVTGLNGLVEFLSQRPELWQREKAIGLVPVIFTTANLWVTKAALSGADIETGNIEMEDSEVKQEPWLFYHYHQSPTLKHTLPPEKETSEEPVNLHDILYRDFVRPIPIVTPSGLEHFLNWDGWGMLDRELMA